MISQPLHRPRSSVLLGGAKQQPVVSVIFPPAPAATLNDRRANNSELSTSAHRVSAGLREEERRKKKTKSITSTIRLIRLAAYPSLTLSLPLSLSLSLPLSLCVSLSLFFSATLLLRSLLSLFFSLFLQAAAGRREGGQSSEGSTRRVMALAGEAGYRSQFHKGVIAPLRQGTCFGPRLADFPAR